MMIAQKYIEFSMIITPESHDAPYRHPTPYSTLL